MLHEPLRFHGHVSDGFALALKHIAWIRQLLESKSYLNALLSATVGGLGGECLWKSLEDAKGTSVSQLKTFLPEALKPLRWIFQCLLFTKNLVSALLLLWLPPLG